MANSVDPDQMPHSAASDLGQHCLQRPTCPNIQGYYSSFWLLWLTHPWLSIDAKTSSAAFVMAKYSA